MSADNTLFQSHSQSQMSIWDPESVTASVKRTKFLDSWKNVLILINVCALFGMGMVMIFQRQEYVSLAAQNEDEKIKNSISSLSHVSVLKISICLPK